MSEPRAKIHEFGEHGIGPRAGKLYSFHCPGCKYSHPFEVNVPNGTGWTWNGSFDKPTFSPSLLIANKVPGMRCHSFVKDGYIHFLNDCYHELSGQTVELPDWDDDSWQNSNA